MSLIEAKQYLKKSKIFFRRGRENKSVRQNVRQIAQQNRKKNDIVINQSNIYFSAMIIISSNIYLRV